MVSLPLRSAFALALCMTAAGCASAPTVGTPNDTGAAPARLATYACDGAQSVTIEHNGASIRMRDPLGAILELPAAPPGQQNRFGNGADAVVIEGSEALVMSGNAPPLTCMR